MLAAYQLDQARRNLNGYAVFGVAPSLGVRILAGVDCGCGCDSCRTLGEMITPAQAVQQALSTEPNIDPRDKSGWLSPTNPAWAAVLQAGQMSASAFSPNCATQPAPNLNLFQTVSGLAIGTTAAGVGILAATHSTLIAAGAIPVIGAVIAGAGVVISIVDMILAHHSAAVKQEQQLGCAAIAASNNAITLIDQAVQGGQMRASDASAGLDALYQKVAAYVAPAVKHSPCNANCEMLVELRAIVNYRKSLYANLAAAPAVAQPTPVTSSAAAPAQPGTGSTGSGPSPAPAVTSGSTLQIPQSPAAPANSPNWLMIAALVAGGFALARFA
jgi:hypothetical protein